MDMRDFVLEPGRERNRILTRDEAVARVHIQTQVGAVNEVEHLGQKVRFRREVAVNFDVYDNFVNLCALDNLAVSAFHLIH